LQPVGGHEVAVGEDVGRRAVGDDRAVVHHQRPRAQLEGVRQVVGDHQDGQVERADDVGQLPPAGRVEVRRRLV
ncbi:hypothetical protein EY01_15400, partial [Staphylococcus aureus]